MPRLGYGCITLQSRLINALKLIAWKREKISVPELIERLVQEKYGEELGHLENVNEELSRKGVAIIEIE